jgi:hypothetical protein
MSKRGKSYKPYEDTALCQAWVDVSTDTTVGRNQTEDTFYNRVRERFDERVRASGNPFNERTAGSLSSRISTISMDVAKFIGHARRVGGPNGEGPSGTNEMDLMRAATILFESVEKYKFKFESCWYILREEPKWTSAWIVPKKRRASELATAAESDDADRADAASVLSDTTPDVTGDRLRQVEPHELRPARPMGMRRAKVAKVQERLFVHQVRAAEILANVAQRRIAAAEEYNEIQLFALRPPADDIQAQEYVRLKRASVLARMGNNNAIIDSVDV